MNQLTMFTVTSVVGQLAAPSASIFSVIRCHLLRSSLFFLCAEIVVPDFARPFLSAAHEKKWKNFSNSTCRPARAEVVLRAVN
jgi:hypothetical protein